MHGGAHLLHGLDRDAAGLARALLEDVAQVAGPGEEPGAALPQRLERGVERDDELLLHLDVTDGAGAIARLEIVDLGGDPLSNGAGSAGSPFSQGFGGLGDIMDAFFGGGAGTRGPRSRMRQGADALIVMTEWKAFKSPNFAALKGALAQPVIYDGRNLYDPAIRAQGFEYVAIGR